MNWHYDPRNVHFQLDNSPLYRIPGDPYASHTVTALNLFPPAAERWFSKLLSDALAYVRDDHLRDAGPFQRQLDWIADQYDQRIAEVEPRNRRKALASGTHSLELVALGDQVRVRTDDVHGLPSAGRRRREDRGVRVRPAADARDGPPTARPRGGAAF